MFVIIRKKELQELKGRLKELEESLPEKRQPALIVRDIRNLKETTRRNDAVLKLLLAQFNWGIRKVTGEPAKPDTLEICSAREEQELRQASGIINGIGSSITSQMKYAAAASRRIM